MRRLIRGLALTLLGLHGLHGLVSAQLPSPAPLQPLPSWAELEALGARIGQIQIDSRDIFDPGNPKEDKLLFRWANKLHIQTREGVIRRALLFKSGELFSQRQLEETERLLRGNRYLYDVQFRALAYQDGLVDIEVSTRDTWTLDLGASAGRSGGANSSGIGLKEYNLLGTGVSMSFSRNKSVDRSGNEFLISSDRSFGSWTSLSYSLARNNDGRRETVSVVRPFYALDARWSAGLKAANEDRIDAIYNAGNVVAELRHRQRKREVFGGWSAGLVDGWVQRYTLGVSDVDESYAAEPGRVAPARLPTSERLVAPFLRYELIEDRFERQLNRNLIGRPEFFALGLASTLQLGWASSALGSSRNTLLFAGSISRGFEPQPEHTLIVAATTVGQHAAGDGARQRLGVQAQYYLPQGGRWLFYAAAAGDRLARPDPLDALLLGGDNGLRGYPLRYQSGTRRALFTVEERFYTDLYVWQLFRVGGAAFYDLGRAWGGDNINTVNPGWLRNAGVGLRIVNSRAAFSNVLHLDIAFPIDATADIRKTQFLVKTKTSF